MKSAIFWYGIPAVVAIVLAVLLLPPVISFDALVYASAGAGVFGAANVMFGLYQGRTAVAEGGLFCLYGHIFPGAAVFAAAFAAVLVGAIVKDQIVRSVLVVECGVVGALLPPVFISLWCTIRR